jgi:regulation of enolase protein 1 (concanavalin A-like superfamily)
MWQGWYKVGVNTLERMISILSIVSTRHLSQYLSTRLTQSPAQALTRTMRQGSLPNREQTRDSARRGGMVCMMSMVSMMRMVRE